MKVNAVVMRGVNTVRVPVDTSNLLHLEIEVDGCTYRVSAGDVGGRSGKGTALYVSANDGRLAIRPIASNAIEIREEG